MHDVSMISTEILLVFQLDFDTGALTKTGSQVKMQKPT